jgi:hypothetical protein
MAAIARSNSESAATSNLRPRSTPPEIVDGPPGNIEMLMEEGLRSGLGQLPSTSTTSLSSVDSQNSQNGGRNRQQLLEDRHQELLKKQKLLQEQYSRLQQLSRGQIPKGILGDLKKTGSESNIMSKSMTNPNGGSLTQLLPGQKAGSPGQYVNNNNNIQPAQKIGSGGAKPSINGKGPAPQVPSGPKHVETQKIYETDIL